MFERILNWILKTSDSYSGDLELEYRSSLLAKLIIAPLVFGIPMIIFYNLTVYSNFLVIKPDSLISWGFITVLVILYFLNRKGKFRAAKFFYPVSVSWAIFTISLFTVVNREDAAFFLFLLMPMTLGVILYDNKQSLIFTSLNIVLMLFLPIFFQKIAFWDLLITYALFMSVISSLILLAINTHRKIEKIRRNELKRSEERKDFLNTLIRQDLRSKSQSVQAYHQLLEDTDLSEKQEEYFEKSVRLEREVYEILEMAKKLREIEKREWVAEKDIGKILGHVIETISGLVDRKGVKIEKNYPKTISKVEGDYSLNTLFTQLLVTRIQIGECDNIKIEAEEREENVSIRIKDNGKKLSDDIKVLFTGEPYTGETTGVGGARYYMIRQIAEHNKAEIEVRDSELGGARFDVHLRKA